VRSGEEPLLLLAEGVRLVEEAIEAGREVVEAAFSPRLLHAERGRALLTRLHERLGALTECSDRVMERASALTTHQGVLAFVRRPAWTDADLLAGEQPILAVAAGVQDPGNMGALVRTAEAAGASGLIALRGSADPFRDKAVRGSAGSIFRLPCRGGVLPEDVGRLLEKKDVQLVASDRNRGSVYWESDLRGPVAIVLGSEASGIPGALLELCERFVRIPMAGTVESLNVAVAAGLLLFEARRQRS
jgi:TrmH family RNA methyltransferase